MSKIAIITDSDASLPESICQKYGIHPVPISIHFGEKTYQTSIDIKDKELFEIIDRDKKIPTTSAPSPKDFMDAFQKAFDDGAETVICICVSSTISATYQAAVQAAEYLTDKDIEIIDSQTLTMVQGFMVMAAAEAAANGASKEEVIKIAKATGDRSFVYGALPTLKYLAMGGRVGKLAAGMADTLNIKPILTSQNGKLDLLEKVRTQRKAIKRIIDLSLKHLEGKKMERVAIIHVDAEEDAKKLLDTVCEAINCPEETYIVEFTPGLSVHAGKGLLGIVATMEE